MKSKWYLISSIFQVLVGIIAIIFFIILVINGEVMIKWIITLFLAIAYVMIGTIGIIDNIKNMIKKYRLYYKNESHFD